MNDIWEFHSILDEKHGDVISNNVPISLFGVELPELSTRK